VLGEKPVAGMDGFDSRFPGGAENTLDVEVALAGGRRPDRDRGVGLAHVGPVGIDLRMDGDRSDAEGAAGANDAAGDLAPIRDQDARQQGIRRARWDRARGNRSPQLANRPQRASNARGLSWNRADP